MIPFALPIVNYVMWKIVKISVMAAFAWWVTLSYAEPLKQCPPPQGLALQVLGSGGPVVVANDLECILLSP